MNVPVSEYGAGFRFPLGGGNDGRRARRKLRKGLPSQEWSHAKLLHLPKRCALRVIPAEAGIQKRYLQSYDALMKPPSRFRRPLNDFRASRRPPLRRQGSRGKLPSPPWIPAFAGMVCWRARIFWADAQGYAKVSFRGNDGSGGRARAGCDTNILCTAHRKAQTRA